MCTAVKLNKARIFTAYICNTVYWWWKVLHKTSTPRMTRGLRGGTYVAFSNPWLHFQFSFFFLFSPNFLGIKLGMEQSRQSKESFFGTQDSPDLNGAVFNQFTRSVVAGKFQYQWVVLAINKWIGPRFMFNKIICDLSLKNTIKLCCNCV